MNRYRWLLVGAVVLVAGLAGIVVAFPSAFGPAGTTGGDGGAGGTAGLIPVTRRVPAPDFAGITGWINSSPIRLADRHAGATLIDFWTFSCVNCTRTIPHLQTLYAEFHGSGLEIVGVHSPEFDFEKDAGNVRAAVQRLGVTWPVALDPDMATWTAWGNQYWPAEYLVDSSGRVAYVHFGEGADADLVAAVRGLVGPAQGSLSASAAAPPGVDITPELYAGQASAGQHHSPLGDGEALAAAGVPTDLPADAAPARQRDALELSGRWVDRGDRVEAVAAGHVRLRFHAADLFVVAGSTGGPIVVAVSLDGAPPSPGRSGPSLGAGSTVTVSRSDLFHLLTAVPAGDHVLDIAVPAGFVLYTLTFG